MEPLDIGPESSLDDIRAAMADWIDRAVPARWVEAGRRGGPPAVRQVRTRQEYEDWYPVFGRSGLVVPTWPRAYGGLDLHPTRPAPPSELLRPYNLGRLNPLGLNLAAPALFAHGTEEQRRRYLPPIVRNEEVWCQLFSEPGSGSDLASLATRGELDGDRWAVTGQKIWTTWAHLADFGVLLARTDPGRLKRDGMTYFLLDLRQPGVEVRPLRHMGGEVDFNEVFLDGAIVPDDQRVGAGRGRVEGGQCHAVGRAPDGGRIGFRGRRPDRRIRRRSLIRLARQVSADGRPGGWDDPVRRDEILRLWCEERVREWTNQRVRAQLRAGRPPGPESSIGKVHQGSLNQRIQLATTDLLGPGATAWPAGDGEWSRSVPHEVRGMLRSRANTIEGGTTEVNKNILGERVLGLPREPDPWRDVAWRDVPRS